MQACIIAPNGELALVDRPEPKASGDIVKVRIEVIPMCTEFKELCAGRPTEVLGHEAVGVVVEAGPSAHAQTGQRVVVMSGNACGKCATCLIGEHIYCRHQRDVLAETGSSYGTAAYAQYIIKPHYLLLPVPDDISFRHAGLAHCGLGPSLNALCRMKAKEGETIVISGCGPVGLGAIVNAIARGMQVIASEPNSFRAKLALRLGALATVDPGTSNLRDVVSSATGGDGADCAIETSGVPAATEQAMAALRPLGRMALLAWDVPVRLPPLIPQGLEVDGCWHWNHMRD
ncbi:MAG TPA: zinc-binding dehydrogenase, partial [Acidimicrobiales bacterium]|nr:zinc-binding dehydrogenase [Acidimicrobiales bacterium]